MPLFNGEKIDFSDLDDDSPDLSDSEVDEKYIRGEIRIVTEQARYPLSAIPGMFAGDSYELNPEFQRRHRWSALQQSRLSNH
jgi:hypothetical protein